MATTNPSDEVRSYLAAIGAKGGKQLTPAKREHLRNIASKGGKALSAKRLAQIRAMTEQRVARQQARKVN